MKGFSINNIMLHLEDKMENFLSIFNTRQKIFDKMIPLTQNEFERKLLKDEFESFAKCEDHNCQMVNVFEDKDGKRYRVSLIKDPCEDIILLDKMKDLKFQGVVTWSCMNKHHMAKPTSKLIV